jgi:hypothetical protein
MPIVAQSGISTLLHCMPAKKNRAREGPVAVCRRGADITFQRGTTAGNFRRDLGGWATVRRQ